MDSPEIFRRRHLPHWDVPRATYFITVCLHGSIPAKGLLDLERYEADLARRPRPEGKKERDWAVERWKRLFARTDHWLDHEPAVRHLAEPQLARVVADALYFFAGKRYDLLAYVVMPSHFHWVFRPTEAETKSTRPPRERIMHSVKRFTARECNKLLGARGAFWQQESYDHWARDMDELERIIHYVEQNPVKAGLVDAAEAWEFSSAYDRRRSGGEFGQPLLR